MRKLFERVEDLRARFDEQMNDVPAVDPGEDASLFEPRGTEVAEAESPASTTDIPVGPLEFRNVASFTSDASPPALRMGSFLTDSSEGFEIPPDMTEEQKAELTTLLMQIQGMEIEG